MQWVSSLQKGSRYGCWGGLCLEQLWRWLFQSPLDIAQVQGHVQSSQQSWRFHLSLSSSVSPSPVISWNHVNLARTGISLVRIWEVPAPLWISALHRAELFWKAVFLLSVPLQAAATVRLGWEAELTPLRVKWHVGVWKSSWIGGQVNLRTVVIMTYAIPLSFGDSWGSRNKEPSPGDRYNSSTGFFFFFWCNLTVFIQWFWSYTGAANNGYSLLLPCYFTIFPNWCTLTNKVILAFLKISLLSLT